ncbi:MAG TPA: YnbE family lipoprotein [Allosphingosinicella sp.]|nr:YnbE family lipoprotein [Allosphingosinicella sp.]
MLVAGATASVLLGACVQVSAPDRPIEVNLNINIRQEVVVRLQQDARDLIQREQRDY